MSIAFALAVAAAASPEPPVAVIDSPPPPVVAVTPVPSPPTHVLPPPVMGPSPPLPVIVRPPQARVPLQALVTVADYPASALAQGQEGMVGFSLDVGPDGRVHGCTVTRSSGSAALDSVTCMLMRRRARFTPATDSNGMPAPTQVAATIDWRLPSRTGTERGA